MKKWVIILIAVSVGIILIGMNPKSLNLAPKFSTGDRTNDNYFGNPGDDNSQLNANQCTYSCSGYAVGTYWELGQRAYPIFEVDWLSEGTCYQYQGEAVTACAASSPALGDLRSAINSFVLARCNQRFNEILNECGTEDCDSDDCPLLVTNEYCSIENDDWEYDEENFVPISGSDSVIYSGGCWTCIEHYRHLGPSSAASGIVNAGCQVPPQ